MAWLKSVGCDCPECGPDPCTAGCACTFSEVMVTAEGTTGTISEGFSAGSNFILAKTVNVQVTIDSGTLTFNLYADAALIYSSGSISSPGVSTTANVPAGTSTITMEMVITSAIGPGVFAFVECQ